MISNAEIVFLCWNVGKDLRNKMLQRSGEKTMAKEKETKEQQQEEEEEQPKEEAEAEGYRREYEIDGVKYEETIPYADVEKALVLQNIFDRLGSLSVEGYAIIQFRLKEKEDLSKGFDIFLKAFYNDDPTLFLMESANRIREANKPQSYVG